MPSEPIEGTLVLRRSQDDGIEKQNGGVQHELDRKDLSDVEAGAGRRRPRRMRWSRLLGIFLPWFCMLCMAAAQLQHFRLDRLTALAHLSSEHPSSGLTIVSGFFFVRDGKKHTQHDYWVWIENFLSNVQQPVYFYTSPDLVEKMRTLRGNKPIVFNTTYASADEMPPMVSMGGREWAAIMNKMDAQSWEHVPGVYGPWISKPWMVQNAKNVNPYQSEYFFWVDAGGFREDDAHLNFTIMNEQVERLYKEHQLPDETIILGAPQRWPDGTDFVKALKSRTDPFENLRNHAGPQDLWRCYIQGGFYGGKGVALDWWASEHLDVTKVQAGLQRFAAKEQDTWEHVARLSWRKILVMQSFANNGQCGRDPWFAYEYWASKTECSFPVWNGPAYARNETGSLSRLNVQQA